MVLKKQHFISINKATFTFSWWQTLLCATWMYSEWTSELFQHVKASYGDISNNKQWLEIYSNIGLDYLINIHDLGVENNDKVISKLSKTQRTAPFVLDSSVNPEASAPSPSALNEFSSSCWSTCVRVSPQLTQTLHRGPFQTALRLPRQVTLFHWS